jgi:hypothetical protein
VGSFSILPIGTYAASANFHQPRDTTLTAAWAINALLVLGFLELQFLQAVS